MDQDIIKATYDQLKAYLGDGKLDATEVIGLTLKAMELVEKVTNLTGPQKKQLVLHVVQLLVNESDLDPEVKDTINTVIRLTLPAVIDAAIAVSRGQYNFNTLKTKLKKLCTCA